MPCCHQSDISSVRDGTKLCEKSMDEICEEKINRIFLKPVWLLLAGEGEGKKEWKCSLQVVIFLTVCDFNFFKRVVLLHFDFNFL